MIAIALCAVAFLFPGVAHAFGTVTGDVVNDADTGIEGISVVPLTWVDGSWTEQWALAATTDPIGGYSLPLSYGEYRIRFVDTDGRVTTTLGEKYYAYEYYSDANWVEAGFAVVVQEGLVTDLGTQTLLEGATISGTVTADDGGAPLADIHAIADVQFGGGWPGVLEDITDAGGAYSIVGLPPGTYQVHFWDFNQVYASERYNDQPVHRLDLAEQFAIDGPSTSVTDVSASLAAACSISGTISGDATPLNGAYVWLAAWNDSGQYWMWAEQTTSANDASADGRYTFAGLQAGTYRLMVEDPDGSWASECYSDKPPIPYAADDITVGGEAPTDAVIDVDLAPAGYIEGWVLGEGEPTAPLEGSPVNVCINQSGWYEAVSWASTDASGYFKAGGLADGVTYYVQFMGDDGWLGEIYDDQRDWSMPTPVSVTAGLTTTLNDAILSRGASIEGHVYRPDGTTPLGNIGVTPVRRVSDDMGNEWSEFRDDLTTWTDGAEPVDGHFLIEGLEPGDWAVWVYDPTGVHAAQFQDGALIPSAASFTALASGDSWAPVEITMQLGGSISGTVYDDGDPAEPIEGITVAAWIPFGGGYEWITSVTTGSDGTYQIDGLAAGEVFIEFAGNMEWLGEYYSTDPAGGTKDRSEADPVLVTPGDVAGPFDANLDAAASVSGYVTTGGGATPLGNIAVVPMQFESDGDNTWWNHRWDLQDDTDGSGFFEIGGLTPGTWSLMYTDPNGMYATEYWYEQSLQSQADMFDITGGGPVSGDFDVDLEMGCTITGHVSGVTESDPVDLGDMGVSANVDTGDWYESVAWASTDPLGDYTLGGMGAGTYLVEFYGDADWLGQFYSETHPYTREWTQATPLTLETGGIRTGIDALLQHASQITGQVTTFDGVDYGYAEGINVMALTYNDWDQRWEFRWDLQSMTGENGFYTIGGLDGGDYRIFFQDPNGYWASEFYHDAVSPLEAQTVGFTSGNWVADEELVPGNTITGTVTGFVEASGLVEPLGEIMVAAGPYDTEGYYEHIAWAQTSSADATGTFELRGLPVGSFKVQIWDDSGTYVGEFYDDTTDWWLATPVEFTTAPDIRDLGIIDLATAASLTGHVTNGSADLAGIDVVPLYWRDDGDGGWWEERWDLSRQTGNDGTFTLSGLTPSIEADVVIMFQDPFGMYAKEYYNDAMMPSAATMLALATGSNELGEIVLEMGNHITGTVTSDGTTGIGDINVAAGPYDSDTGQYEHIAWASTSVEEGFEGTYHLGGLLPGSYVVQFWDESGAYLDQYYSITVPCTRDIQQATPVVFGGSGETSSGIDAQMAQAASVSGTITADDGITKIAGVSVVPIFWQSDGSGSGWWDQQWHRSTQTDENGRFVLTGFELGETFRLLFQDPSGVWAYEYYNDSPTVYVANDIGPLSSGENELGPISLVLANHITGTVYDSLGTPLGNMSVAAGIYDFDTDYYEHVSWTQTSDEDGSVGTYDLGGLPPGSYVVQFWGDLGNYATQYYNVTADWKSATPVDFGETGLTASGVDAYLDPAAYVSGTVYGDAGAGELAGIDVQLYTYNGEGWDSSGWMQTEEGGAYRFGGLADGTVCRLWFSDWTGTWAAEAYMDASSWSWGDDVTTTIDTPAEGIDVTLSRAGSVTGVVSGGGVPLVGAPVTAGPYDVVSDQWDQYLYAETDENGRYTLTGAKPGVAYRVQAGDYSGTYTWTMWTEDWTGDGDWHSGDDVFVLAPPEAPTVCDFDLTVGGSIIGHVENAIGEDLENIWVMLFAPTEMGWDDWWGSWQGVQGSTDIDGQFRVGGLYPGEYRIAFVTGDNPGDYATEYYDDQPILTLAEDITITALGQEVALDSNVILSEAATIEGHVYDGEIPAPGLEGIEVRAVVATDETGGWRELEGAFDTTDGDGWYILEGIRPEDEVRVHTWDPAGYYLEEWWQEAPGPDTATPVHAPQSNIDFTLEMGGYITGTISLDPSGTYENIGVTIYRPVVDEGGWHFEPVETIHGGWGGISTDGGFRSGALPPGEYGVAFYDDSGVYASEYFNNALLRSEATLVSVTAGVGTPTDATLTRAATIHGSVSDFEGPVGDVEVRALIWDESWERWEPAGTQFATSDGDTGGYVLAVPTGRTLIFEFSDPLGRYATQFYDGVYRPDDATSYTLDPGNEVYGINAWMLPADSEAPSATLTVDPVTPDGDNGWYVTAPAITLTSDDPSATLWYAWNEGGGAVYVSAIEPPAGTNTLTYWATDPVGNESDRKTHDFKYDPLAPEAPTSVNAAQSGSAEVTVTWVGSFDEHSGLSHYELWTSSDGTAWSLESDVVASESYMLEGLISGDLYVKVKAVDMAGNTSLYSPSDYVNVDADAPVTTVIVAPATPDGANGWYVTVPSITLSADDLDATTFYYWDWDPDSHVEYSAVLSAVEGTSTLAYYSVDSFENTETPVNERTFKVDTAVPTQVTGLGAIVASESAIDLEWNAATDDTSGVSGYRIYQDGSFVTTVTATAYQVTGLTSETLYSFTVSAYDQAGNEGPQSVAAEATTLADTTAPTTTIEVTGGTLGQNGWYTAPPSITLTPDEPATTWYQWGSDEPLEYKDSFQPPVGENVLTYWSVDGEGNTEDPKPTRTFKFDETAPSTPGDFTAERSAASSALLTWSASSDAESGIQSYAYTQTGPQSGSGLIGSTLTSYTINSLPDGTYTFKLLARNGAGLTSAYTETLTVVIDNIAPVTTASTVPAAPDGTNGWFKTVPSITLGSTATDLDWIVYRWGDGSETTYTAAFQPPADGTYTLWWHGADESGNVEAWKSQEFKVDTGVAAPTGLEATAVGSNSISLAWNADLVDTSGIARYLVYRDGTLADEVTDESCQIDGLAASTTYIFTLKAIDDAGNESAASEGLSVTTLAPATYTVTFRDWDGTILKIQTVVSGGSATAPPAPTRDGYIFIGWDKSFSVVMTDLTVNAMYTPDDTIESPVTWETIGGVDYARVAGDTRFETAAWSALDAFPHGASTAIVAYGLDFPDALAASPLAGAANGPILLTQTTTLPEVTASALRDLGVTKVYIVGGTGVVGPAVETALRALGITDIERLAGDNRYITARKIADEAVSLGASTAQAFLVRGDDFADALAVASIAAQEKIPVLLTTTATLNAEASGFFTARSTDDVYIAGGTGAVSDAVASSVTGLGASVTRWAGADRYATGAKVVSEGMELWDIPMIDIGLASGANYPDALAGGAVMGYKHGLLMLTNPTALSPATGSLISANKVTIESVEYFGGTGALSPAIPTSVQLLLQ